MLTLPSCVASERPERASCTATRYAHGLAFWIGAFALTAFAAACPAQTVAKLKFALDWKFEGQTAFTHMAKAKGYFQQEGLDVQIDAGNGSAGGFQKIASGAYDIVLADLSSLIEFIANNPDAPRMQAVYLLYDEAPIAYFTLKKSGINTFKALAGQSITGRPFEIHRKLWPLVAKTLNIDAASVKWVTLDISLRSNAVINGDAAATGGFYNLPLEFEARGVKRDELNVFKISDLGLRFYGNAVITSSKLISDNPAAVGGFVRAMNRAFREALADPADAIKYLKAREPIVDEKLEYERFVMLFPAILTPRTKADGLGAVDKAVLDKQAEYITEAFGLKSKPDTEHIFNPSFLPARAERLPLGN